LNQTLTDLIQKTTAHVGVLYQDLSSEAPNFSYNAFDSFSSASTIKTLIMLSALTKVSEGAFSLDTPISVPKDKILEDSRVFDLGPRDTPLRELIYWMITTSDNTSTNVLIDLLSFESINAVCPDLTGTALRRKMLDFESKEKGIDNTTTPHDMYLLFKKLYTEQILPEPLQSFALSTLEAQRDTRSLRRYIPEDFPIGHKTGGLDYLSHDCGVLRPEGSPPYFLGVFIENAPDIDGDPKLIGQISILILNHLKERS
jgi:beta-lactamase class A